MNKLYENQIHTNDSNYTESKVWLSNKALNELGELLDLYYKEYELSTPLQISKLCSMGLMMLSSLSVKELKDVDNWYRRCKY